MTIKEMKHNSKRYDFVYNPFEIFVEGRESLKKSIFCNNIIENISKRIDVAYINFSSDNTKFYVSGKKGKLLLENRPLDIISEKNVAIDYDFVLINIRNFFDSKKSKRVVFLEDYYDTTKGFDNIILFTGEEKFYENLDTSIPFIDDDYIDEVSSYLTSAYNPPEIYGLILTGGESSRMGQNKSLLNFNGKEQYKYLYELMLKSFSKTFISCKEYQKDLYSDDINKIFDSFNYLGAIGGIISALNKFPDKAWFVIACDLPYVDEKAIKDLILQRNYFKYATTYISSNDNLPEPLCTIYEPKSKIRMTQFLGLGYDCPRKFLINSEVNLINQADLKYLTNINYYTEYQEFLKNNDKYF